MIEAIHVVNKGRTYLSSDAGQSMRKKSVHSDSRIPILTRWEKVILGMIAEGFTIPEIASQLFLSPATVDTHRKNLLAKLNVKNTASQVKFAMEHHLTG